MRQDVPWEGLQTTFPHFVVNVTTQNLWNLWSEWLLDSWSFTKTFSPRLLSSAAQIWKEVVPKVFLFKMMEVSGTSCTAEMLLQPPPGLCLDTTPVSELWRLYLQPHDLVLTLIMLLMGLTRKMCHTTWPQFGKSRGWESFLDEQVTCK